MEEMLVFMDVDEPPPAQSLSAVLLEHNLSVADIVLDAPTPLHSGYDQVRGVHHCVIVPHDGGDWHFITRIACAEGDAAAITVCIGGMPMHRGLALPFAVPIAALSLQFHQLTLESAAGAFVVEVTYGSLQHDDALYAVAVAHTILWQYADGVRVSAWHGKARRSAVLDEAAPSPQPLP